MSQIELLTEIEDPVEFEKFSKTFREALKPDGAEEDFQFNLIVSYAWRRKRAQAIEKEILNFQRNVIPEEKASLGLSFIRDAVSTESLKKLQIYEAGLEKGYNRAVKRLHELQRARSSRTEKRDHLKESREGKK